MPFKSTSQLLTGALLLLFYFLPASAQIESVKHTIDGEYLGPHWIVTTDMNADGHPDVVATSTRDGIRWYENNGSGIFTIHNVDKTFKESWQIFVGDLDNDQDKDILGLSNTGSPELAWYANNGDGTIFTKETIQGDYSEMHGVWAADLKGNGHMDILAAVWELGNVMWWENDGNENYQRRRVDRNFSSPHSVQAADLDGDGDIDVVAAGGSRTAWWQNNGNNDWTVVDLGDAGGFSTVIHDLDGDGDPDILRSHRNTGDLNWFENLGNGAFVQRTVAVAIGESWSQAVGDIDGDGDNDVVIGEYVPNQAREADKSGIISYWLNDGNENFTGFLLDTTVTRPRSVNLADYDGDGDLDIGAALTKNESVVWYELTPPAPSNSLTLTAPNGGESFLGNETTTVTWTSTGEIQNIKIEYSTNNGSSWNLATSNTPNDGSYNWSLPNLTTSTGLVRISDTTDPATADQSNAAFSITQVIADELTITAPNGGETWTGGSLRTIMWTSTGNITTVKIDYSTNNGASWTNIVATAQNNGNFNWNVPDLTTASARVRISDAADNNPQDQSDNVFTIEGSSITVTSPNGGEQLNGGDVHTISWSSTGIIPFVDIDYSTNGGISWTPVAAGVSNMGSLAWTVPDLATTNARIRVRDSADGVPSDQSNGSFSIAFVSLTLFAPNGGEIWLGGSTQNIIWTSNGNINTVKLEYSTDDGANWQTIIASTANDGLQTWVVPDIASSTARVRVSDVASPARNDVSENVFTINGSTIAILAPNGGEAWQAGSLQQITWNSTGIISSVKITFKASPSSETVLVAANADNNGTYHWIVPDISTDSAKVSIWDAADDQPVDESDGYFSIVDANLVLTAPNGGEIWSSGSLQTISWDSTGAVGNVNLDYSVNGGESWLAIENNFANTGSYLWTVPNWLTFDALVRVSGTDDATVSDQSDETFSILSSTLTITSPNGGEQWEHNSTKTITWHSTGLISSVDLEYSMDGGTTWQIVVQATQNDGSYRWTLPATLSSEALVRVANNESGTPADVSDGMFSIVDVVSSVSRSSNSLPEQFAISQNYPNPFNMDTRIELALPESGRATLRVYNIRGELVATLHDGALAAGNYSVAWNGKNRQGVDVPSGIYIYSVQVGDSRISRRMLLVK